MNTALSFSLVLPVLIIFSIDPDTSLVADNTFKQKFRDIAVFDDKLNKDKGKNKIQNGGTSLSPMQITFSHCPTN